MDWRNLLSSKETLVLPWTGGRYLHAPTRRFKLDRQPQEMGWYSFSVEKNTAHCVEKADPEENLLKNSVVGYLVGNRLVADNARIDPNPAKIVEHSETVHLIPEALDRFARIKAGRVYPEGPLIFQEETFPLGPESDVQEAFFDQKEEVHTIPGVTPALDAAFRMETHQRKEAERRRQELARKREEERIRQEQEQRRQELVEKWGADGALRRQVAQENFEDAAKAALQVSGATYIDHRRYGRNGNEWLVTYRVQRQRLQCICNTQLQIIDAGICLTDEDTGEKGDTYFTLESLPAVVREAIRDHKLVVYRHG